MSLNDTPRSNRLHIGIFGKRNSGKSSLINAITGHQTALVSDVAGTTTDPVLKSMEINGIGPCVLIDTAGFDDLGELGKLRVEKTREMVSKTDIAVLVFADADLSLAREWVSAFEKAHTPVLAVINKADMLENVEEIRSAIQKELHLEPLVLSAATGQGVREIRQALIRSLPEDYEAQSLCAHLVQPGDVVLLVMPQDIQAPKGRLILPQVQTIRDLLDNRCLVMSAVTDQLDSALAALSKPPKLIITDSQVFKTVYEKKPPESLLTSFSVLLARYKGDIAAYAAGAAAVDALTPQSHVLIAESCTHAPLAEDIGREKIPRMLRKKVGESLSVTVVSGTDFPEDLTPYDLIIQCGACMFNRKYVLSRIARAKEQRVPITNYGVVIAKLTGILDKVEL